VWGVGLSRSLRVWGGGLMAVALLTATRRGGRPPRYGHEVMIGSLVLLVLPFLTLPVGASVARVVKITSENPSITLFFRSISTSLTVSVVAVLMAFPVAYYLAFCRGKSKYTWLVIVIAPFLTSYLLRVLAFKVILTDDGLVNTFLFDTGLRTQGHQVGWLLYTQFTVLLVLLYAWVPFVTLPIFVALENMDRRLLEAATDLGASRVRAFLKITLPIAAPGIVAAFLFVFIPTIGEFVTPQLVGGSKGYLFGSAIADDFGQNSDWQSGAVLALFLMLVVLLLTATTSRFLRATGGGE
jgi:spermidine/putrescine transport system permease protein